MFQCVIFYRISEIILSYNQRPQRIFFQCQIFDTYTKFESILASAENEIILIDNYVDLSILQRLTKKKANSGQSQK
ncbi:MAG: hypothetical protein MR424_07570 [Treponema sp.]|nr:hypothetical protein [Treponema sp.]